ncbi:DUF2274 domain-containing protein [uncultured Parasphingorhabdus sp.]|uniref:DUF2274 domain-containing protein n=1 Tax=uncultured Parasphingorhabdus sp. TaxID=2709694 RepID=UPI0030DD7176|tara:strand:- start:8679 stop:8909 length:231 start_codon:yes stop_codon:yes gene_type:complete
MAALRISKLPDRTPIKLTISVLPDLNDALADYATIYAETYRQTDSVTELIPAMLTTFLESDKEFKRSRAKIQKDSQ